MSFGWSLLSFRVTSSTKMCISDSLPIFSYLIKLYWEFTSFFHKKQRQILDLRRQSGIVPETATLPIFSIYFIILFLIMADIYKKWGRSPPKHDLTDNITSNIFKFLADKIARVPAASYISCFRFGTHLDGFVIDILLLGQQSVKNIS